MNIEQVRECCLNKPAATEEFPFDDDTLAFKVCNKIFALLSLKEARLNLKCDPAKAVELREQFPSVTAAYHMHKRLWNTVMLDGAVPDELLRGWVDDSYALVVDTLTKAQKLTIKG